MVKARTGTGKTLAFLIPAVEARLQALEERAKKDTEDAGLMPRRHLVDKTRDQYAHAHAGIVIISPTRELATQIGKEALKLTKNLDHIQVHMLVGGESKNFQLKGLRSRTHDIIVATPGRMMDLLDSDERFASSISHTQTVRQYQLMMSLSCLLNSL
jgi:ATP-dependent RNA helicase MSS116